MWEAACFVLVYHNASLLGGFSLHDEQAHDGNYDPRLSDLPTHRRHSCYYNVDLVAAPCMNRTGEAAARQLTMDRILEGDMAFDGCLGRR